MRCQRLHVPQRKPTTLAATTAPAPPGMNRTRYKSPKTPRGSPQRYRSSLTVPSVSPPRRSPERSILSYGRTAPRSPKSLQREQPATVQPPSLGCEYRAARRAIVRARFEADSEQLGFLEPGDVVLPVEVRPTPTRGQWRLRIVFDRGHEEAGDGWVSELTSTGVPLLEPLVDGPNRLAPSTGTARSPSPPPEVVPTSNAWARTTYECINPTSVRVGALPCDRPRPSGVARKPGRLESAAPTPVLGPERQGPGGRDGVARATKDIQKRCERRMEGEALALWADYEESTSEAPQGMPRSDKEEMDKRYQMAAAAVKENKMGKGCPALINRRLRRPGRPR